MDQQHLDINNMNQETLSTLETDQLVRMVLFLKEENEVLKKSTEEVISKKYDERLEKLEREINRDRQYARQDTIEISGINPNVSDDDIEDECLKILKTAKVKIGTKFPTSQDIHAAHRKRNRNITIVKFVNRKFAEAALFLSSKLKEIAGYEDIYIKGELSCGKSLRCFA